MSGTDIVFTPKIDSGEMEKEVGKLKKRLTKEDIASAVTQANLAANIVSKLFEAAGEYFNRLLSTNKEFQKETAKLKGALATAFQPLYETAVPVLMTVLHYLTRIANIAAVLINTLFGRSAAQSAQNAQALNAEAAAIGATGSAAQKASKQLAKFDDINKLNDSSSSSGSGGGSSGSGIDVSAFSDVAERMTALDTAISGCLLALGAILTFSGANIPVGLALLSMGALGITSAISENWNALESNVEKALLAITALASLALFAIGVVMLLTGNLPLGIGMIIAGASGFVAAATVNFTALQEKLKGPLGDIVEIASGALLAIGMSLAFSGVNIPLGLAMIAIGGAGLAAIIAVNWSTITELLKGPLGDIVEIASGFLLAIGMSLAFSGVNIPLGLSLMAAGATGLVSITAVNWSSIVTEMQGTVGQITAFASGALLAIGLMLALSGVATPLGLAMIAAGSVGMVTTAAFNWDTILENCKTAWGNIKTWFTTYVAPIFTAEWWNTKLYSISLALAEFDLPGKISAAWEDVKTWFSTYISPIFTLEWWSGLFAPITTAFSELDISGSISTMWANVKEWYTTNIAPIFTLEWWTNLLASVISAFDTLDIKGKVASAWNDVKAWYTTNIKPIFTLEWWLKLFSSIGDGLSQAFKNGINIAIELMNGFIRWINSSMTFSWGSFEILGKEVIPAGGFTLLSIPEIPLLAQGAVIPPNSPFTAILGDQRNGTNIETPESLLRQVVREESGSNIAALLEELIGVVQGISIGDETIARAANRGNRVINRAYGR